MCPEYPKAREFINILARIANFTTNGSHGAMMLFSDPATMQSIINCCPIIGLDNSRNLIEFSDQLDTNSYTKVVNDTIQAILDTDYACSHGATMILNALNDSLTKMFQKSNGMREDTEKVAVLITDGRDTTDRGDLISPDNPELLQNYTRIAENFKQRKIKIIVIGVGWVNEKTLKILVQSPEHLIKVDTFDNLVENLTDLIGAIICKGM